MMNVIYTSKNKNKLEKGQSPTCRPPGARKHMCVSYLTTARLMAMLMPV